MPDIDKTKEELVKELDMMRLQVDQLKAFQENFAFAEKQSMEKDEGLSLFIEKAPVAVAMFDREMRYMGASGKWLGDHGLSGKGYVGQCHWDVFPETPDSLRLAQRRALAGETVVVDEVGFRRPDGCSEWLRLGISPWNRTDGGIGGVVIFCEDMTERREHEKSLESNFARIHAVLASLYVGCLFVTSDNVVSFVNQAFCDMFFLEEAPGDLAGLTAGQMIDKLSGAYSRPDEVKGRIMEVIARNEPLRSEEISIVGDKTYSVDFIPITVDGSDYGRLWFHSDISERKQMEEATRESEKKFSTAFLDSPVGVVIVSAVDGKLVEVNEVFVRETGYTREEIIGRTIEEIGFYENYDDRDRLLTEVSKNGRAYGMEISFLTKSGQKLFCSVSTSLVQIGGSPHFLTSIMDVTRVKLAQEALAEREERYRLVVATCPDAILISRLSDGRLVEINEAFTELSGYTVDDVMNRTTEDINLWADISDREDMVRGLREKGKHSIPKAVFRRKDGSLIYGAVSAAIMSHLNEPHLISISRDITDWVRADEERRNLEAQLFHARQQASLGTLVGGIAHDFNNMLQIIIGYGELLMDDIKQGKGETKLITTILKTADTAAKQVTKFMDLGQQSMVFPSPTDLNQKIREIEFDISRLPNIEHLEIDLVEEPTIIKQDPDQLGQIIMSLATNASEAMPNGGILSISTNRVTLDERFCKKHYGAEPGPHVLLTVTDTGRGIDEAILPQIFDPFFSTKERGDIKGMGLGLSVLRGIVQQRGGFVTCESRSGEGATFRIYFPEIQPPATPVPAETKICAMERGKSILIVEDSSLIARLEQTALDAAGYNVIMASDARDAVNIYRERHTEIGLVILDILMPEMNGRDCMMELLKINPLVKAIVLTGHDPKSELSLAIKPHVISFLPKPCRMSQLVEVVQLVIEG